jgi:hypothetical protein
MLARFARVWGPHAARVLVSAARRNELQFSIYWVVHDKEKFAMASRHRPQASGLRYPEFRHHTRTGTLAVRSSLPQLTHAPLIARKIAFQMQ